MHIVQAEVKLAESCLGFTSHSLARAEAGHDLAKPKRAPSQGLQLITAQYTTQPSFALPAIRCQTKSSTSQVLKVEEFGWHVLVSTLLGRKGVLD